MSILIHTFRFRMGRKLIKFCFESTPMDVFLWFMSNQERIPEQMIAITETTYRAVLIINFAAKHEGYKVKISRHIINKRF